MKSLRLMTTLLTLCVLTACSTFAPIGPQSGVNPAGLSYGEIITLLGENRPQSDIITMIRGRGMREAPQEADIDALRAGGASQPLVDAVLIASWQPDSVGRTAPGYSSVYPGYYGYGYGYPGYGYPGYAYPGYAFPGYGSGFGAFGGAGIGLGFSSRSHHYHSGAGSPSISRPSGSPGSSSGFRGFAAPGSRSPGGGSFRRPR